MYEGRILDGRNRYFACLKAGVKPKLEKFSGTFDEALAFVISHNLRRRHLDASQKAMAGARLLPMFSKAAKERQSSGGLASKDAKGKSGGLAAGAAKGKAVDQAGEMVGVSGDSPARAAKVLENSPTTIAKAVESGEIKVKDAGGCR